MESIIKVLSDPGAWVAGILFGLISSAIYNWFELLPNKIRGLSRAKRLKNLRRLREARQNPMEITFSIVRANAQFVAFLLMCFFYLGALIFSDSLRQLINQSWVVSVLIALPIFIFELVWLNFDLSAKRLVREYGKLIKYRSQKKPRDPFVKIYPEGCFGAQKMMRK